MTTRRSLSIFPDENENFNFVPANNVRRSNVRLPPLVRQYAIHPSPPPSPPRRFDENNLNPMGNPQEGYSPRRLSVFPDENERFNFIPANNVQRPIVQLPPLVRQYAIHPSRSPRRSRSRLRRNRFSRKKRNLKKKISYKICSSKR